MKHDALFLEPAHPATQQGGRLAIHRKDPAGTADVGLDTELSRPIAQRISIEVLQPCGNRLLTFAIALRKQRHRIGMREIQAAFASDQEFASHRTLGIVQIHCQARRAGHFRRHQTGRPTADHGQPLPAQISHHQALNAAARPAIPHRTPAMHRAVSRHRRRCRHSRNRAGSSRCACRRHACRPRHRPSRG